MGGSTIHQKNPSVLEERSGLNFTPDVVGEQGLTCLCLHAFKIQQNFKFFLIKLISP